MARRQNSTNDIPYREVYGDSSHLEDHVMKVAAQFFGEDLLPYLGIQGKIKGIAPTEQIHLEVKRMEEDFNFLMEDGSWRHLEFESDRITEADLRRFREYDAYIGMAYQVPVVTTVLCSAKTKVLKQELVNGPSCYRVEVIRLKERNADELLQELERKIQSGEALNRKNVFPLMLIPLLDSEAGLYALAIKFLEKRDLDRVKERIRMTILGQMLREDGVEEGRWVLLITQVMKKLQKGQSLEKIAEDLLEEVSVIEAIVKLMKENPGADSKALFEILRKTLLGR